MPHPNTALVKQLISAKKGPWEENIAVDKTGRLVDMSLPKFRKMVPKWECYTWTNCALITVTSHGAQWRLNSPAYPLFDQPFVQALHINIKPPRHWPLWGESTGDRWIPPTKSQWRGGFFHLVTSSLLQCCRKVSLLHFGIGSTCVFIHSYKCFQPLICFAKYH